MIRRDNTPGRALFCVFQAFYLIFGIPLLLFFGSMLLLMAIQDGYKSDFFLSALAWAALILPCGRFIWNVFKKKRLLKNITNIIHSPDFFCPEANNEIYHYGDAKYLGIDTKNGTLLYIHRIRGKIVDVLGLTINEWTNREVEGNIFRLYTRLPELPRIQIATPYAQRWFDMLGAMEYKKYDTSASFSEYVAQRSKLIEKTLRVRIPELH